MWGARLMLAAALACVTAVAQADWPIYLGASYGVAAVDGTADADSVASIGFPPEALSINGLPFDDDDGAWSAFIGYELFDFMALEAGYADFGRLDSGVPLLGSQEAPGIGIDSAHLTLRFRIPVTDSLSATWHAGVSRSDFDVSGSLRPFAVISPNPPFPLPPVLEVIDPGRPGTPPFPPFVGAFGEIPYADPEDETGFRWGFGFDWRFQRHLSAGLEFSRENVEVLTLDTYKLRLTAHL